MALGASYATTAELKSYAGDSEATDDTKYDDALAAASRSIDKYCHRQFNVASSATARVYYPGGSHVVQVDDISTTTGLVIKTDEGNDGTYEVTWDAADYQLEPINGVVDGETGWPYWMIRAVRSRTWPGRHSLEDTAPLQVTATWGWAAVPSPVKMACLMLGMETLKLAREAPFGVAGFGAFGVVRVRDNPRAMALLQPYVLDPVLVA